MSARRGENACLYERIRLTDVTVKAYSRDTMPSGAGAYSVCVPNRAEVDVPSESAVAKMPPEMRGILNRLEGHECAHLLWTMCKDMAAHDKQQQYMLTAAGKVTHDHFHKFFNIVEDPRIERILCDWKQGMESGFGEMIEQFWQAGDMAYVKTQDMEECLQLYLLLAGRCRYHHVDVMRADVLAARQDLMQYVSEKVVDRIDSLLHDIVMTGRPEDVDSASVLRNTCHVMDCVAEMLKLCGLDAVDQSQQNQQSQGQDSQQNQQSQGQDSQQNQQSQGQDSQPEPTAEEQADADSLRAAPPENKGQVNWDPDRRMGQGGELLKDIAEELGKAVAQLQQEADRNGTVSPVVQEQWGGSFGGECKPHKPDPDYWSPKSLKDYHPQGEQLFKARLVGKVLRQTSFNTGSIRKWGKAYSASVMGRQIPSDAMRKFRVQQDHGNDVDIVLDASGSMRDKSCPEKSRMLVALPVAWSIHKTLLAVPHVTCRVTTYSFDETHVLLKQHERVPFSTAASRYTALGGTPTHLGVTESMQSLLSRPGRNKLMLVVTDGEARNDDWAVRAVRTAQARGIHVIMVFIGGVSKTTRSMYDGVCDCVDVPDMAGFENAMYRQLAQVI